jgi:hypothetical protein
MNETGCIALCTRASVSDAELKRRLMPLETCEIERSRTTSGASRNLRAPTSSDPPTSRQLGKYARPKEYGMTGEGIKAESIICTQIASLRTNEDARMHPHHECRGDTKGRLLTVSLPKFELFYGVGLPRNTLIFMDSGRGFVLENNLETAGFRKTHFKGRREPILQAALVSVRPCGSAFRIREGNGC